MKTLTLALLAALSFASAGTANAANETVTLYNTTGVAAQFCTDTNGVRPVTGGVYATGVTPSACSFVPPVEPVGRLTSGQVCYTYTTRGPSCRFANYTDWQDVFGRYWMNTAGKISDSIPFPGVNYYQSLTNMKGNGYFSAKFVVPSTLPALSRGIFFHAETLPGPFLDSSISTEPGNFNPASAICKRSNTGPGATMLKWKNASIPDSQVVACPLTPGGTYYFNVKISTPSDCAGSCVVTLQTNRQSQ